jgi:hypothetical protein
VQSTNMSLYYTLAWFGLVHLLGLLATNDCPGETNIVCVVPVP